MKKTLLTVVIIITSLIAGCSGAQAEAQTTAQNEADTGGTSEPNAEIFRGMQNPAEITQLLFGTFLLEDTDLAINAEQASALLPLWKVYRSLLESDITAEVEIEAVAKQIAQNMTSEQLATIEGQPFNREQIAAIMEELGVELITGAGRGEGVESPDGFSPPDGFRSGQGGGPGAGGPGGTGVDPEVMATRQAEMEASGGFQRGFNLPLVEALIELLEQRPG